MTKRARVYELKGPLFASLGGTYAKLNPPKGKPTAKDAKRGVQFWADLVKVDFGGSGIGGFHTIASIGLCRVTRRNTATDPLEFHIGTDEGILPLDKDIILLLSSANAMNTSGPNPNDVIAFRVPKHTFISLPKGTWHWAPIFQGRGCANVLILLPPATYKKDCTVVQLKLGIKV